MITNGLHFKDTIPERFRGRLPNNAIFIMDLLSYFDPHYYNHMLAYKEYRETGRWPDGFPPIGIRISEGWQPRLNGIIARYFFERTLPNYSWLQLERLGEQLDNKMADTVTEWAKRRAEDD
jgi:hypothetical protein